jgi:hypothetical protein
VQAVEGDVEVRLQGVRLEVFEVDRRNEELEFLCALELALDEELVEGASRLEAEQVGVVDVGPLEHDL